jgi:hypothetical protein
MGLDSFTPEKNICVLALHTLGTDVQLSDHAQTGVLTPGAYSCMCIVLMHDCTKQVMEQFN